MALDSGVFFVQKTITDGSDVVIEVGWLKDLTVQVNRDSGAADTATVQVSNDGVNYVNGHSRRDAGTGNVELSALTASVETLLEVARYVKITFSGSTDPFTITLSGPSARG